MENIYIQNSYDGRPSTFAADIAILELKAAADLNEYVVPACINTSNKFILNYNSVGSLSIS